MPKRSNQTGKKSSASGKASRAEKFLENWLSGTTCRRSHYLSIYWVSEDGRFAVLKHAGHSEWGGRASGRDRCPTYYCLFDMDVERPIHRGYDDYKGIHQWHGRWKKQYTIERDQLIAELCGS